MHRAEEAARISTGTFLPRIEVKNPCFPGIFEMLLKDFLGRSLPRLTSFRLPLLMPGVPSIVGPFVTPVS